MMIIFSVSLLLIMLGGCWACTHYKNQKVSYICILVALILNIMSSMMIYVEHSREVEGYQKLLKKVSLEIKNGNTEAVTEAIDGELQNNPEAKAGNIWLMIQQKKNQKKAQ